MKKLIIEAELKRGFKNSAILTRNGFAFKLKPNELDDSGIKGGDKVKITIERIE